MSIFVYADGMEKAVKDALNHMDADGGDGVDYPIGVIRGMQARLVIEPKSGCYETIYFPDDTLCYVGIGDGTELK